MSKVYIIQEILTRYYLGKVWAFTTKAKRDRAFRKLKPLFDSRYGVLVPYEVELDKPLRDPDIPDYEKAKTL